ncbi:MAG: peptidoglycan glycosyltransferase [Lachnospiraceae bacterium]|nr:peptidoglycan glycosyltransferase [Lachnospiraceae bacterium]
MRLFMLRSRMHNKKKLFFFIICVIILMIVLVVRLSYLMVYKSLYYSDKAEDVHQRERVIKAARGCILDRNGEIIASNKTVCTISVIYNQIEDSEKVIEVLSKELSMDAEEVRKKVSKVSSIEKIKSNVDKEIGDRIRAYDLAGVKVDEDYKRYYPFSTLASKVLGFTGADNQGIIGLEVWYEEYLKGDDGKILTTTDAKGVEIADVVENRVEPVAGLNLVTSLDVNIQKYCEQAAKKTLEAKEANYVSIIVMNPQNGEIYAMVNAPEFDLNNPYELNYETETEISANEKMDALNKMWRNQVINDTYEPGSTFKMITATAAIELGVVNESTGFSCPGFKIVDDRRIRCHKTTGHGAETFQEGLLNSCNPVFIETGLRLGKENLFLYMDKLGLMKKTSVDLPGEAGSIMHNIDNVKNVELATMSFGQSFQITPLQLLTATSAIINGGRLVTPHFGVMTVDEDGNIVEEFQYSETSGVIDETTSEKMKSMLEKVVSEGGGSKCQIEGYLIGGKTATSEKLPRGNGKYIASFIGFAPADNPEVIAMCIIDEPTGIYYGGTIATPVIREVFENILPYLGVDYSLEKDYTD